MKLHRCISSVRPCGETQALQINERNNDADRQNNWHQYNWRGLAAYYLLICELEAHDNEFAFSLLRTNLMKLTLFQVMEVLSLWEITYKINDGETITTFADRQIVRKKWTIVADESLCFNKYTLFDVLGCWFYRKLEINQSYYFARCNTRVFKSNCYWQMRILLPWRDSFVVCTVCAKVSKLITTMRYIQV